MTAEEYFQKQNGGKPSQDSTDNHEDRTATECVRLMERYANDRLDSYKEAQRQAIEEWIQHLERLMADSETGTEDWFKIGHLISEAKRNFSILLSVTPKE